MRKLLALAAIAAMLTSSASFAHFPEGQIFGAWQWPSNQLPSLDGESASRNACTGDVGLVVGPVEQVALVAAMLGATGTRIWKSFSFWGSTASRSTDWNGASIRTGNPTAGVSPLPSKTWEISSTESSSSSAARAVST